MVAGSRYDESSGAGQRNVYAINVENPDSILAIADEAADEHHAYFQPGGGMVVYQADQDIWLASFPELDDRRQLTANGGFSPRWSRSGDEILYWRADTLWTRPIGADGAPAGAASPLFEAADLSTNIEPRYDVGPDAERFLIQFKNPDASARAIHVVENWFRALLDAEASVMSDMPDPVTRLQRSPSRPLRDRA